MAGRNIIRLERRDELALAIAGYLDDLALRQRRPRTLANYRWLLERYWLWCMEQGVPLLVAEHTPTVLRSYLRSEQVRGVAAASLVKYHAILRGFFTWCVTWEYIEQSPLAKLPAPTLVKRQPEPFSSEELAQMERALLAWPSVMGHRNRAIVALWLDTGLRRSETCALRMEHVNLHTGEVRVVEGKGGKDRVVMLGATGRSVLRRYWQRWRASKGDAGPLFLSWQGGPLHPSSLNLMCKALGKRSGVANVHPHRFRHHCALSAVRAGMGLFQLQVMLGHTDLDMVRWYANIADSDLAEAMRVHSPLDYLKLRL